MATMQGSKAKYRVVIDRDVPMHTRDGVTLYSDAAGDSSIDCKRKKGTV